MLVNFLSCFTPIAVCWQGYPWGNTYPTRRRAVSYKTTFNIKGMLACILKNNHVYYWYGIQGSV